MRKFKLQTWSVSMVVCTCMIFAFITACQKIDYDTGTGTNNNELNAFLKSSAFSDFKDAYGFTKSNLLLNESEVENNNDKGVNVYHVPVMKRNRMTGRLLVISKADGAVFKTIYENMEAFDTKTGVGEICIEINGRFVARYISTPMTRGSATTVSLKLIDVAECTSVPVSLVKTRSETTWPSDEDGWWDCTTRCINYAKEACHGDTLCDIICRLADIKIASPCSGAIGIACGIYCI